MAIGVRANHSSVDVTILNSQFWAMVHMCSIQNLVQMCVSNEIACKALVKYGTHMRTINITCKMS
jgi:hypothetical protein